ncbi:MAG TPA: hypothetical protein VGO78_20510 [Acidimicrobiales bacterium]|jgi:hypothetical protein|nr:hypothetical protein [Acidimicrobiales bacterium]
MRIRREPQDDYLHPLEDATNFNESRYYNFYDPAAGLGGWVRMGNRPNEGYAEMTTCFYLPSGQVAFMFGRPHIEGHTAHDAGGLKFDVVEPYAEHRVSYQGQVLLLDEPKQMEDPKQAFVDNPRVDCTLDLQVKATGPAWGGEPEPEEGDEVREVDPEKSFAKGHTEQHMASTGAVTIGDQAFEIDGALGLRDHSWGPRYWQAVWWYRWLTVNLSPDLGFATTVSGTEEGARHVHGFLYDRERYGDDRTVAIRDVQLRSDYDDGFYHHAVHVDVTTDDHTYPVEGDVWSNIPLRNRRNGLMTRITEGMTTWRYGDLEGAGLSEYLDQIVDGRPVGIAAGG